MGKQAHQEYQRLLEHVHNHHQHNNKGGCITAPQTDAQHSQHTQPFKFLPNQSIQILLVHQQLELFIHIPTPIPIYSNNNNKTITFPQNQNDEPSRNFKKMPLHSHPPPPNELPTF